MSGAGEAGASRRSRSSSRDYDEAIAWYSDKLGFALAEDVDLGGGKRWVTRRAGQWRRAAAARQGRRASRQARRIGDQTGGRVFLFLETDDFARDHAAMLAKGVAFKEEPRHEAYGTVAVFADLYGNLWDLIEPKR